MSKATHLWCQTWPLTDWHSLCGVVRLSPVAFGQEPKNDKPATCKRCRVIIDRWKQPQRAV